MQPLSRAWPGQTLAPKQLSVWADLLVYWRAQRRGGGWGAKLLTG